MKIWMGEATGKDLQTDITRYASLLRRTYERGLVNAVVSESAADARKEIYKVALGSTYSWRHNPTGQIGYNNRRGPAWSHSISGDPYTGRGYQTSGANRGRMDLIHFKLHVPRATTYQLATVTSFPMNLWENDAHYRKGSWGPWRKGVTRHGIHWMHKAIPAVNRVLPKAIQDAFDKLDKRLEENGGKL